MADQRVDDVARALAAAQVVVQQLARLDLEGQPYDAVHMIYAARDEFTAALSEVVRG